MIRGRIEDVRVPPPKAGNRNLFLACPASPVGFRTMSEGLEFIVGRS
jgi:hypothetical protein